MKGALPREESIPANGEVHSSPPNLHKAQTHIDRLDVVVAWTDVIKGGVYLLAC
jgi:hypothetical protein